MRKSLTIALLHMKTTFKSKGALLAMFVMPLVLTLIMGVLTAGGGGESSTASGAVYPVAVVDRDGSFAARSLVDMMKAQENLKVYVATDDELTKLFADKKVLVGVVVPERFQQDIADGRQPEVKLTILPGSTEHLGVSPIIRWMVPRLAQDYQLALASSSDKNDAAKVEAAYTKVAAERQKVTSTVTSSQVTRSKVERANQLHPANHASVGFTVTFVMMQVFMMSGVILTERKNGTWGRLLTTPNSRVTIIAGYLTSFFLTGMAQFAILTVATRFLFGVSWGPWLPLFAMGAGTVLAASGMGLFLAGLVKSFEQQMSIGILFINATAMLGGAYWDLEFVSKTMQRIGHLTPQAWAIDGFKEVMLRGGAWESIALPLAVLLGISAVFMTAGLLRVRYE